MATIFVPRVIPPILRDHVSDFDSAVDVVFGPKANSAIAAKLHREDREGYDRLRQVAQKRGKVGQSMEDSRREAAAEYGPKTPQHSPAELAAMAKYTPEYCRALWRKGANEPGENVGKLKAENPQKFAEVELASRAHGVIPAKAQVEVRNLAAERKTAHYRPASANEMVVSDVYADHFHLERGSVVSLDEHAAMSRQYFETLVTRVNELAEKHGVDPQPARQAIAELKAEAAQS